MYQVFSNYCKLFTFIICYNIVSGKVSKMIERYIQTAIDYIESNLEDNLSLSEISTVSAYSEYHFSRLFKSIMAMSPITYVRRRKISEAIYMKFSGYTFYDCAAKFGFSSASTLSRALKSEFNCNYSQYLKANGSIELQNRVELNTDIINWRSNLMKNNLWSSSGSSSYGHSYPTALHSLLSHQKLDLDITDVFGFSGFAFFMNATKGLCPSSMSVFDFNKHLDFAVNNCGLESNRITRLWDEYDKKELIRDKAVLEIKKSLDEGKMAIAWDAVIPEWCLIVEYNKNSNRFLAQYESIQNQLNPEMLGQREIEILDVTIINSLSKENEVKRFEASLKFAVELAKGLYNIDENYKQGLESYKVWINEIKEMTKKELSKGDLHSIGYHLNMLVTSRFHASIFINRYCKNNENLVKAASYYQDIALEIQKILSKFNMINASKNKLSNQFLNELIESLSFTLDCETKAIESIENYIK